jgi:hypothetical protein
VHGQLITVNLGGVADATRAALALQVKARLDPLTTKHEIAWS